MRPFSNDPSQTGASPSAAGWAGQVSGVNHGAAPWVPGQSVGNQGGQNWMAQPAATGVHAGGPANTGWTGQPAAGQEAPTWVKQSAALPSGVEPTQLKAGAGWPALRTIARVLKIIAWIELAFGVIVALLIGTAIGSLGAGMSSASAGGGTGLIGVGLTLYFLIVTAIGFLLTFGSAELILVFLTIEKNTRKDH